MKSLSLKLGLFAALLLSSLTVNAQSYPGEPGWGGGHGGLVLVRREIYCASDDYRPRECGTGLERTERIRFTRQLSKSACIQGSSYDVWGDRISVRNGCRAVFVARGYTRYPQGNDQIIEQTVTRHVLCESQGYGTRTCAIPLRRVRDVRLVQQHSKSACIEGHSFRYNDRYIEVSQGCRGTFAVTGY